MALARTIGRPRIQLLCEFFTNEFEAFCAHLRTSLSVLVLDLQAHADAFVIMNLK